MDFSVSGLSDLICVTVTALIDEILRQCALGVSEGLNLKKTLTLKSETIQDSEVC